MKKLTLIVCLFSLFYCLTAQTTSLQYQFKGVGDEFADEFATNIITDMIAQSKLQVVETVEYVLTYEQKTLKMTYSAKTYYVSGEVQQENADLYSDLEGFVQKAVSKSLEDLKTVASPKEEISKQNETPVAPENVSQPILQTPRPVSNEGQGSAPTSSDDASPQNKIKDSGATWQKIKNFIMAPRNKSDKIVALKTSGKLSTFTTLKSTLTAELTDEGILKISGTGRMLTEDESLLRSLRPYVIAIEVEEGVTEVSCFQNFASVEYVLLPSTVRRIASSAFKDCIKLGAINIPESTTEIGSAAFQNCEMLSSLILPENLSSIGDKAFLNCRNLKEINIPSKLSVIAESIFRNCQSIENIEIPSSVTHIKENAFKNCRSISKLYLSDNVVSIEKGCFQDMKSLTEVKLSEKLVSIPSGAFESCSSLSNVIVPQSVQMVSEYAFKDCENLVQITFLCNNMRSIGEFCFEDCNRLCTIYLHSRYPPVCPDIFDDKAIRARVAIMVPSSSLSFYMDADFWKTLNIRPM